MDTIISHDDIGLQGLISLMLLPLFGVHTSRSWCKDFSANNLIEIKEMFGK